MYVNVLTLFILVNKNLLTRHKMKSGQTGYFAVLYGYCTSVSVLKHETLSLISF